jgi:hypothetical protein
VDVAKDDDQSLVALRTIAANMVAAGSYEGAGGLLTSLLSVGFDVEGTHVHLARICLLSDKEETAREHIRSAWEQRAQTELYVVLRIVWYQICFAIIDRANSEIEDHRAEILRQVGFLKFGLQLDDSRKYWASEVVIDKLRNSYSTVLTDQDIDLLQALVGVLSGTADVSTLNDYGYWRDATRSPIE